MCFFYHLQRSNSNKLSTAATSPANDLTLNPMLSLIENESIKSRRINLRYSTWL